MNDRSLTITVLMPVYNGSRYLAEAIESILNQTFTDFEFLIIDDASKDNSLDIIKSYDDSRIRLVENDHNLGQTATLNKGIKIAKGKYIARLDQDDLSLPKRLEKQVKYLEDNPNICVVGSWWENIDENNRTLKTVRLPIQAVECGFWLFIYGEQPVGHPCVMFRATEIISLGGYNEIYNIAQDADLWLRASANNLQFANIPEVLLSYRIHGKQGSKNSQADVEHNSALSTFLSEILSQHVDPLSSALIRPINYYNAHFDSDTKIDEMFRLKEQLLAVFFKKYNLSADEILRCVIKLWKSLDRLCNLKITNRPKMILRNIIFCNRILQVQQKQKNIIYFPSFILFNAELRRFLLKQIFLIFIINFRKVKRVGISIYKKLLLLTFLN